MPVNKPQAVLDDPILSANKPQDVRDDLALSSSLCKQRQKVDVLHSRCSENDLPSREEGEVREKIRCLNNKIVEAVEHYKQLFIRLIKKKLYRHHQVIVTNNSGGLSQHENSQADDALQIFYEKRIIRSTTFCNYEAKNNAYLKTFLLNVLYKELKTFNQHIDKIREHEKSGLEEQIERNTDNTLLNDKYATKYHGGPATAISGKKGSEQKSGDTPQISSLEERQQKDLTVDIIREALGRLKEINEEDALLINLKMQGLEYQEIARQFLEEKIRREDLKEFTDEDLEKEKERLRQRKSRCMTILHIVMTRIMSRRNLANDSDFTFVDLDRKFCEEQKRLCEGIIRPALEKLSEIKPQKARDAKLLLNSLSVAEKILLFGSIGCKKITTGRPTEINALHPVVQNILSKKGLLMTIERGTPVIKKEK